MPANVTPEYDRAEERYRQAETDAERLAALREMLSAIPKHKGTEKMQADIKRRISQLRKEERKSGVSKGPDPFHIPKTGAGQVVLVGPPNTGKSSLLAATTNAEAKVADYPFTTLVPQPGMWVREDVPIELVDTPPLAAEHIVPGLMGTIRHADLVCVVAEAGDAALGHIEGTLEILGAKGLALRSLPQSRLPESGAVRPGLIVANKVDLAGPETLGLLRELYAGPDPAGPGAAGGSPEPESGSPLTLLAVSARTGAGLGEWFEALWRLLAVIRVYPKQPGKAVRMENPFVLRMGSTVADLARQIHRELPETMRFARLWGHGRFEGQQVHKTEVLADRDVVEIHE